MGCCHAHKSTFGLAKLLKLRLLTASSQTLLKRPWVLPWISYADQSLQPALTSSDPWSTLLICWGNIQEAGDCHALSTADSCPAYHSASIPVGRPACENQCRFCSCLAAHNTNLGHHNRQMLQGVLMLATSSITLSHMLVTCTALAYMQPHISLCNKLSLQPPRDLESQVVRASMLSDELLLSSWATLRAPVVVVLGAV